jgi:ribosomal protein L11 methyltransferase
LNKFYYELKITPNNYYELYLDLVLDLTCEAIEELKGTIILRSEETLEDIKEALELFTTKLQKELNKTITCDIVLDTKENQNWIQQYKDAISPITIDRFHIHPTWSKPKDDKINIQIDPALAFGSGHHETTSSCLKAISRFVKKDDRLLDVGSGSGILAIGASKLEAICDICDTDLLAIENAIQNFSLNKVKPNKAWEGSVANSSDSYDVVVANIVADILIILNKDLKKVLKDDGILILSGILTIYKDKVLNKFKEFKILEIIQNNEWSTLILKKGKIDEKSTK